MPEPAYPTYVVEQSEYETEPVQVVTVNKPNNSINQSEELLKKLLAVLTPIVPPPPPPGEGSRIITNGQASPTVVIGNREEKTGPSDAGRASGVRDIASNVLRRSPRQELRLRPVRRNWSDVKCFSCGKTGHSATRFPTLDVTFPFILPGWKAEKTINWLLDDILMISQLAENAD